MYPRHLVLLLALVVADCEINNPSCVCWEGYRAEYSHNGYQCVALSELHIMPCNMPRAPKCQCSGKVSSILKDRTGTWCTRYRNGAEFKRWPCENTQEWDEFFKKYPDFI
ncbi:unnamed protein product [Callosobruchus maculatus]|uniref:Uncharacterized protein n=1 Tax=Callosobruchus maculatus TaxID=64391 RepID=A0A653CJR3_CALMS|nr:unnamed protein product [Callosobruchus maculatus]